jgi:hypothetical protein
MPCEAGKTSRNPVGVFTFLGAIARLAPKLAALVKGQVFSMSLYRRKFDQKPHGSIRRKDFIEIDAGVRSNVTCVHTFETISARRSKRVVHHHYRRKSRNPSKAAPFRCDAR